MLIAKDAERISALYLKIKQIDHRLEHLASGDHHVNCGVWGCVATGNYDIPVEMPRGSPFTVAVRGIIKGYLLYERELCTSELQRLGFE